MSWLVLVISGVLEAVWATALGRSDGLTRAGPDRHLRGGSGRQHGRPRLGHAHAPGRHVVRRVGRHRRRPHRGYAMVTGAEPVSVLRMLLLLGIVACVVGLELTH